MENNFNIPFMFSNNSRDNLSLKDHMLNFSVSGSESNDSDNDGGQENQSSSRPDQPTSPLANQGNPNRASESYPNNPDHYGPQNNSQPNNPYMGNGGGQYPPPYNNYPYGVPPQNNGQYIPPQAQANFGFYGNYYGGPKYPNVSISKSELKKMHSVAVGSVVIFFLWLLLLILFIVGASLLTSAVINSTYTSSSSSYSPAAASFYAAALILWLLFWFIGNLVCGIVGSVRSSGLSKKVDSFTVIMILYIIGIFIPIIQVVAAFMALSRIKQINI